MRDTGIEKAYELIDHILVKPQPPLSDRYYYVNYHRYEGNSITGRWVETEEELYIGPYPYPVAEACAAVLVINRCCYKSGHHWYLSKPTLSLKARRGSRKTTGPTRDEIESYLLSKISGTLLTYRGLQDWYANTGG